MALGHWMLDAFGRSRTETRWIDIEGHRMHSLKAGHGPDLILLHGLLGTASAWDPVMPALAAESTLYAMDALGIGRSERVPGLEVSLQAQAGRVISFMDQSGIRCADLLGTSYGGSVALTVAARYPERVKNLLLHAPANPYSHQGDSLISFYLTRPGAWFARRIGKLPEPMQALALGRMYGDASQIREGSLRKYMESLRVPGTVEYVLTILQTWYAEMAKLKDSLDAVRPVPTLLLWGDRDRAVSIESAERLRCCFDRLEFQVLPGTGHLPYEECPETLARLVNAFLSRARETGPRLVQGQGQTA